MSEELRQVSIQIPVKLWSALAFWASYAGKTKKEIIIEALTEYLEQRGIEQYGIRLKDE